MILPMKRVYLIVSEKEQNEALLKLRALGVMHIEKTNVTSEGMTNAYWRRSEVEDAFGLLETYLPSEKDGSEEKHTNTKAIKKMIREDPDFSEPDEVEELDEPEQYNPKDEQMNLYVADHLLKLNNYRQMLEVNQLILQKERDRIADWGNFNPNEIRELAAHLGQKFYLYQLSSFAIENLPEEIRYIKIGEDNFFAYIIALDNEITGLQAFTLPDRSLSQINSEMDSVQMKLDEITRQVKMLGDHSDLLEREKDAVDSRIEFESVLAEFVNIDENKHDHNASYLRGYTLAEDAQKLKAAAKENGWAFISHDPSLDDEAPVKMVYNKPGKIISPLLEFLDILPCYHEADISGWFLLFFAVFFGIIFGDAGYGVLLFLVSLIGILKTRKKGVPDMMKLVFLLSISNTIWGVMTCSWFGIPVGKLPQFLRTISLAALSPAKNEPAFINQNLQIIFFSLASVHLSIAHIGNIVKHLREKSLKFIAEIGCIAIMAGVFNLILFLVVSNNRRSIPVLPATPYVIGAGIFLTLLFAYYEGNIIKSLLNGLTNIMSVILNVSSMFSDIMSYIRLWALGLAGTSIASMVSEMATPMLGSFLVFAGLLIMAFGHGLNMVLNTLSVMIHGVRLNILEFSVHAGVTWGGAAFKPFAETVKKQ